jgi:hypothetical protein
VKRRSKRLLDRVRDAIRFKGYSARTEEAYVDWVKRFILFRDKRHPRGMGHSDIKAFLLHLAVEGGVAASTQNQALKTSTSCKNSWVTELVLSQSKEREDDDDLHPPPPPGEACQPPIERSPLSPLRRVTLLP